MNKAISFIFLIKIFLLAFTFSFCNGIFARQNLPILLSDSTTIVIKIDGRILGYWHVEADTKPPSNPDTFFLERSFKEQTISYISNRDSIFFRVKPGSSQGFLISLNGKIFPTVIATVGLPLILNKFNFILFFSALLVIVLLIYTKRKKLRTSTLLYFGIISPSLFWIVTLSGGFIHGNYNHVHNVISELGAIGTKSELFMSVSEILIGISSIVSIIGFGRACKQFGISRVPAWSLLSFSISMIWAAMFPMHHELHGAIGPIPLLFNLGLLLAIILWRGKRFYPIRLISFIALFFTMLLLLRTVEHLRNEYEGLIQRFYYFGWTIWSISISLIFLAWIKKTGIKSEILGK